MATNEILPFASTNTGTNLLTQSEYAADSQRVIGHQPGIARSKLENKALRQATLMVAGLAEFIADYQANNVTDSLTPQQIADYLLNAITSSFPSATETVQGKIELATNAEVATGTDTQRAVTPAGAASRYAIRTRNLTAGVGLTGGGDLTADRTVALGTPGTLSGATSNAVSATSHTHAISLATETVQGVIELATNAEAQGFSDAIRAITPSTLNQSLKGSNQSLSGNGYQKLPGGLILQWGSAVSPVTSGQTFTVFFPIAFPNGCTSFTHSFGPVDPSSDITTPLICVNKTNSFAQLRSHTGADNIIEWKAVGY